MIIGMQVFHDDQKNLFLCVMIEELFCHMKCLPIGSLEHFKETDSSTEILVGIGMMFHISAQLSM